MISKKRFFMNIFKELNSSINYLYPRDIEHFNDIMKNDKDVEDLDLLISRKQLSELIKILYKYNYVSLGNIRNSTRDVFLYNILNPKLPHFNIHVDNLVKMIYIKGSTLLKNKIKEDFIYVLNPKYKLIVLVYKDLFLNGIFSVKKYSKSKTKEIEELIKNDNNQKFLFKISKGLIGDKCAVKLITLIKQRKYKDITNKRRYLQLRAIIHNPLFLKYMISNVFKYTQSKICRKSIFISILGVDGSGKTTVINNLNKFINITGRNVKTIYMGRWAEFIIPIKLFDNKNADKKITLSMNEVYNRKISRGFTFYLNLFLRDTFYILEYTLRYLLKIIPARITEKNIICDRYVYDLTLMKNKTILLDLFVKLYPKPNKTFILYNDPEIIWQRKKELTIPELKRQQENLFKILGKNTYRIKAVNEKYTFTDIIKEVSYKI